MIPTKPNPKAAFECRLLKDAPDSGVMQLTIRNPDFDSEIQDICIVWGLVNGGQDHWMEMHVIPNSYIARNENDFRGDAFSDLLAECDISPVTKTLFSDGDNPVLVAGDVRLTQTRQAFSDVMKQLTDSCLLSNDPRIQKNIERLLDNIISFVDKRMEYPSSKPLEEALGEEVDLVRLTMPHEAVQDESDKQGGSVCRKLSDLKVKTLDPETLRGQGTGKNGFSLN